MALVHGLDQATNRIAEAIKLRPPVEVEMKIVEAQEILLEMLVALQDCHGNTTKLLKKLYSGRKPKRK